MHDKIGSWQNFGMEPDFSWLEEKLKETKEK
jgi:hypothetical protein